MKRIDEKGNTVIDWSTGDPEGDRAAVFTAYREFLDEVLACQTIEAVRQTFKKWKIDTKTQWDEFPRIQIERPEIAGNA